jgi:hypothetical protein
VRDGALRLARIEQPHRLLLLKFGQLRRPNKANARFTCALDADLGARSDEGAFEFGQAPSTVTIKRPCGVVVSRPRAAEGGRHQPHVAFAERLRNCGRSLRAPNCFSANTWSRLPLWARRNLVVEALAIGWDPAIS